MILVAWPATLLWGKTFFIHKQWKFFFNQTSPGTGQLKENLCSCSRCGCLQLHRVSQSVLYSARSSCHGWHEMHLLVKERDRMIGCIWVKSLNWLREEVTWRQLICKYPLVLEINFMIYSQNCQALQHPLDQRPRVRWCKGDPGAWSQYQCPGL